ncbi:hypothetical protein G6737_01070 [Polynucleobacter paneuropaeus]|nr:hypothetical protein [Polynucleobacter paneuropaeus]MBT8521131.1 hypothetical protein [Polynucleobacter paneuropaeus]MBT8538585.1 hypothetical protein [Polynucleobacter paneuropaeus]RAZ47715.1 hypothetical protein DP175_05655 [Polynucleobacter paneuropaeus]
MSKDKCGLGDVEYASTIKTQTFKQFQLERLIRNGKVIPASKLADAKKQELERVRDFTAASIDEERHRRSATPAPKDKLESLPLTREPLED